MIREPTPAMVSCPPYKPFRVATSTLTFQGIAPSVALTRSLQCRIEPRNCDKDDSRRATSPRHAGQIETCCDCCGVASPSKHLEICSPERCEFISLPPGQALPTAPPERGAS